MKFFFVINNKIEKAVKAAKVALDILREYGCECVVEGESPKEQDNVKTCDYIVSFGGDGTVILAAKYAIEFNIPLLGVNAGHMGFLCGLDCNSLKGNIEKILDGCYEEKNRMLLEVEANSRKNIVVNDVVLSKAFYNGLINLKVFEGNRFVINYRADSVLFSTPTGSTAYSLSNGGPIANPSLEYISMSPICPHSINNRTFLFSEKDELTVKLEEGNRAFLVLDGVKKDDLLNCSDIIKIRKSERKLKLVSLNNFSFFELVRDKFFRI